MLTAVLKTKTHTFLLDLYLNTRLASFHQQHKKLDMKEMIRKIYEKCENVFITAISAKISSLMKNKCNE